MDVTLHPANLVTIVLYLGAVVLIGVFFSRRENTSEEYLLGGRRIPWWAVGISYMMSLLSTITLVAVPGEIYNHGLSLFMLSVFYPVTSVLMFLLFIRFYFKLRVFTPFGYLERRFGPNVRLLLSVVYLWTRVTYLAMVLYSSSIVFRGAAGWPVWQTVLVVGVVGVFYTVLGGIKAVIWTDVLQFVVLVVGLVLCVVVCVNAIDGGLFGAVAYALEQGRGPTRFAEAEFYKFIPYMRLTFWLMLLGLFMEPMFYTSSDQITVQRLLSTSSYKNAFRASLTNSCVAFPFFFLLWAIGLSIFAFYHLNPDPRVTSGDTALFTFIATQLPVPVPGLILAAMLSAIMSTLDSGMNSLSTVLLKDFYLPYVNRAASERTQVRFARILTVVVGIFAILVALLISRVSDNLRESLIEAYTIWGTIGAVAAPVFLMAVTSRRIGSRSVWLAVLAAWGANAGMICWYIASKSGMTGAIPAAWVIAPLAVAVALVAGALILRSKRRDGAFALVLCAALAVAYTLATGFWYLSSHNSAGGVLSFQWVAFPGLILCLAVGYGSMPFFRKADEKKTLGLTLWSARTEIPEVEP